MPSSHYETAARLVRTASTPPEQLHAAAIELREAFVRNEHSIGLLPGDAPDLLVRTFRAAGDQGHTPALLDLALLYQRGGIAPWAPFPGRDVAAAIELYRTADDLGSFEGALGWIRAAYFDRDAERAAAAAARLGELHTSSPENAEVLLYLGYFLHQGYGFAADAEAAASFFEAAALRGEAAAAFELSILTANGDGVPADDEAAQRWTFRAAELGSDRAQSNLGGMYATGRGVPKDAALAVEWYRRAGDSGNARAAFIAGVMLLTGEDGLEVDIEGAGEQFDWADELGYPDVDDTLAGMGLQRPQ
jgi:TPR repeat protein